MLSLKAGGTGLNLTAASHVVLYDRWWNPAVEDQARDRAWRIGQTRTVVSHRLVCPGTVDERVEEVVAGKRHIADLVLPKSSSLADLDAEPAARRARPAPRHPPHRGGPREPSSRRRKPAAGPAAAGTTSRSRSTSGVRCRSCRSPSRSCRRADPTALLRSLGDPPLQGQGAVAEHYLAAVVERAAGLATALAATAGLLAEPDDDP